MHKRKCTLTLHKHEVCEHWPGFKLDPDSCIVLNLLDHLPVLPMTIPTANLGTATCVRKPAINTRGLTPRNEAGAERVLTSMLLPSLEPKSLRPLRKSPWSFSLMISTTSSRACCTEHTLRVRHETLEHRTSSMLNKAAFHWCVVRYDAKKSKHWENLL